MSAAAPLPPAAPFEGWEFLEWNVLKPSRSSSVCITCQHFRYEVGRCCVTLLTCPIHQGPMRQGIGLGGEIGGVLGGWFGRGGVVE
jgi:hypothetical protein